MANEFIIKHGFHSDGNSQITGSLTATSFVGDGSGLTGIEAGTNLTQSIFVSPSGNDGTAVVGDIAKPFSTILGATG